MLWRNPLNSTFFYIHTIMDSQIHFLQKEKKRKKEKIPEIKPMILPELVHNLDHLQSQHILPQVISVLVQEVDLLAMRVPILKDQPERGHLAVLELAFIRAAGETDGKKEQWPGIFWCVLIIENITIVIAAEETAKNMLLLLILNSYNSFYNYCPDGWDNSSV